MALPRREDGSIAWAATEQEISEINRHLDRRDEQTHEERITQKEPPASNQSFGGALRYAVGVLYQDRPFFLVGGALCALASIVLKVVEAFQ